MKSLLALGRYAIVKAVVLGFAVILATYLTILIVNMGGALDEIRKTEIEFSAAAAVNTDPANQGLPASELKAMAEQRAALEIRRLGLDRSFWLRTIDYMVPALSLNLGRAIHLRSDTGSALVRTIIAERMPPTLILFGVANLLLFFTSLFAGLALSRQYGSWIDKAVVGLAPTSAAPAWFYGIFLILIFAGVLRVLPWGGMVDAPPPETALGYAASLLRHMILPVLAMAAGGLASSIYGRRTFFLIFSSEDYVDLAKAKGLSSRAVERRYILRPTLPPIITSFALMVIAMWMGAIVLETVFVWPGLGRLYLMAVNQSDTPVIIGVMVIYGYLLAISVFLLDLIFAIVDPRVRVGASARKGV
jgi:peptide/nickel transport system permease protein